VGLVEEIKEGGKMGKKDCNSEVHYIYIGKIYNETD
jgi:hypothetical protein